MHAAAAHLQMAMLKSRLVSCCMILSVLMEDVLYPLSSKAGSKGVSPPSINRTTVVIHRYCRKNFKNIGFGVLLVGMHATWLQHQQCDSGVLLHVVSPVLSCLCSTFAICFNKGIKCPQKYILKKNTVFEQ